GFDSRHPHQLHLLRSATIKPMTTLKQYFRDRVVLLLLSANFFFALLAIFSVLLRLQGGGGYIVQYRANLGVSAYKTGGVANLLSFILFAVLVSAIGIILSWRTYHLKRELSLLVLSLGLLLLLLCTIVSNALLALH